MNIRGVLEKMIAARASDLHLKAGTAPVVRVDGILYTLEDPAPSAQELRDVCSQLLNDEQRLYFTTHNEIDFAFGVSGLARFRANIFMQRGTPALALRHVPVEVPAIEDLMLPAVVRELAFSPRGLILVTGRTGSGKSTTLAAMIDGINKVTTRNIITVEDPIEFLHRDRLSFIHQREVGLDTRSFHDGLRYVLRQDPDIILVGEIRDLETMSTALMAADTGHLVLSTLHTTNASQSVNRILDFFKADEREQIRRQLAGTLQAVVCQRMVPTVAGSMTPALEIMINTPIVKKLMEENRLDKLPAAIETGTDDGMLNFNQALFQLVKDGKVTEKEALAKASNPQALEMNFKGIFLDEGRRILG